MHSFFSESLFPKQTNLPLLGYRMSYNHCSLQPSSSQETYMTSDIIILLIKSVSKSLCDNIAWHMRSFVRKNHQITLIVNLYMWQYGNLKSPLINKTNAPTSAQVNHIWLISPHTYTHLYIFCFQTVLFSPF